MQQYPLWPKENTRYVVFLVILIAGFFFYLRPLPSVGLTDPGEAYFVIPERSLPSSWAMAEQDSSIMKPETEMNKKLSTINDIIQNYDRRTGKPVFTYSKFNTGGKGEIEEIYRDNVSIVFQSGDNAQVTQYYIDRFAAYMSGYELYPPRLDFVTAIPRFTNHQSIFRVGSLYSSLVCHEGKQELCTDNFRTLFKFSQQTKNSNTLIGLLIGIVEEGILINHIDYLYHSNPKQYQFLITMLQQEQYFPARVALRNAFVGEYNMGKNEMTHMPLHTMESYDFISTIGNDEEGDPTNLVLSMLRILRIPPKWLFDIPETLSLSRGMYYQIITNAIGENPYNGDIDFSSYRSSGHPLGRKNILGYHFLNALIPRLTGIHQRALDQEARFQNLISE